MKPEDLNQKIAQQLKQWQQAQEKQTSGYDSIGRSDMRRALQNCGKS